MPATQTPQRIQLGRELRDWRERRGIDGAAAAGALMCSPSKLSRIESGHATVSPLELETLLALYRVPEGDPTERIREIAAEARERPKRYRVAPWVRAYIGMEAEAAEILYYQVELIPGLLQTETYTRAVAAAYAPSWQPAEVERLVRVRQQRQDRLTGDDPPALTAVIHEASVRTQVGGPAVLAEQLAHLLRMSELPNVTLRLVPFTVGAHAAMGSPFTILRLAADSTPVVYLEDLWNADYVNRPEQVAAYTDALNRLQEVALNERATVAMIKEIMGDQ